MKIGILEDDIEHLNRFVHTIKNRQEFELGFATDSVFEALKKTEEEGVEGLIVDIELNDGVGGSGLDFVKKLNELELKVRPAIIVTTKNDSDLVEKAVRKLGIDMFYSKNKRDYNPNIVLNQLIIFQPLLRSRVTKSTTETDFETKEERERRIRAKINDELNRIGAPTHSKGRVYLVDAMFLLIVNKGGAYTSQLCAKYHVRKNSVSIAIQDAINYIWRHTPEEDIYELFTANVTYENGAPTPRQFIHYYVDKIKETL